MADSVEIKEIHPCQRELAIQVPAEEMEKDLEEVYRRLARSRRVPGFRPGKAPRSVLETHFGKETRAEALSDRALRSYLQAVKDRSIPAIGDPVFGDVHWEEKGDLTFTVRVDVHPTMELKEYRGIPVSAVETGVSEEEVERVIASFRERSGSFEVVTDRELKFGDWALVDYRAVSDPAVSPATNVLLELKADDPRGLAPQIAGMKPGETRAATLSLPPGEGKEGRKVDLALTLKEIKKRTVPELNDELAKSWGEFDTLGEVREKVKTSLLKQKEEEARSAREEQAAERLLKDNVFPLPPRALERMAADNLQNLARYRDGLRMKDGGEVSEDRLAALARERAEKDLRLIFILEEIARREKIAIDAQTLGEEIGEIARQRKENPAAARRILEKNGEIPALEDRLRRRAALALVVEAAAVARAG